MSRLTTIRAFLGVEGIAFAVVSSIHAGVLPLGQPHSAWIPEGVIAAVLFAALLASWPLVAHAAVVALAGQTFAIGLTAIGAYVTVIGIGPTNPWDLPFHVGALIVLAAGVAVAAHRQGSPVRDTAMTVLQWAIRVIGALQLVVGLGIWTGVLAVAVPFHIANGLLFVLLVELQGTIGLASGAPRGPAAATLFWGLAVLAVGLTQTAILQGDWHWIVRVAHLAIGISAIAIAERLARAARSRRPAGAPDAPWARPSFTASGR
jgi:hypothetical protein